ncbi:MAG: hypothetical protein NTZ08_01650 [Verrucomicrobia bacterium]|nr:hypothetical protein [Verrucomicrobiota bacterium]
MIRIFTLAAVVISTWCLVGCLSSPITSSGGIGAVTVHDTNADAVTAAARNVFASRGYTLSGVDYPNSISFDKPAGGFGNVMWGSYGNPQTIRVRLAMMPIPGTDNIRLEPKVFSVSDAGEAGFDNARPLFGIWNAEFGPMLKDIARKAGD